MLASRDPARTVAWLGDALGVRPAFGGRHPGAGTRNFLLSVGPGRYLEVIGPDPDQPEPKVPRWFLIDEVDEPRLTAWVAKSGRLEEDAARASAEGFDLGPIHERSRTTPDGEVLRWRMTRRRQSAVEVVPTLIDWQDTRHPSTTAPSGASLVSFRAEHPKPDEVHRVLSALSLGLEVTAGPQPRLFAELTGPAGQVRLA